MAEPILVVPNQVIAGPDWDQLVSQHGGTKGPPTPRPPSKTEQAAADDAGDDLTQNPIYRQYLADGTYVEYRKAPNGTDSQIVDYKPSAKFTQQQTRQDQGTGPPGGKAYIDEEGPNGRRLGWNPETHQYDRDIGPAAPKPSEQAKPPTERVNPADPTKRQVWNPQANGGQGAWEDGGAVAQDAPKPVVQQVKGGDGKDYIRSVTAKPDGTFDIRIFGPDGKPASEIPGEASKPTFSTATRNGQTYIVSTQIDPKDPGHPIVRAFDSGGKELPGGLPGETKPTETYRDKDGALHEITRNPDGTVKADRLVPSSETGAAKGPPAPEIIAGHASEALRIYQQQLMNDPTLSAAQREVLWNQAIQMATTTYQEASALEGARQADQSAAVSLSNSRLSNATSGFNTALEAAIHINDRLPVGSSLGGKAFLGLLGIQMQHAHDMGAYDAGPTPQMRPTQFGERPAPGPSGVPAGTASGTPGVPVTAPSADAAQAEADRQRAAAESAAGGPPPEQPPAPEAPAAVAPPPIPSETPAPAAAPAPAPPVRDDYEHDPLGQAPTADPATFAALARLRVPSAMAPEVPASPDDFAALKAQGAEPAAPPAPVASDAPVSEPPVLLHARAAVTPPWRITPALYQRMRAAGVPDSVILSIPGFSGSGASSEGFAGSSIV
jgi:hypothetical protein